MDKIQTEALLILVSALDQRIVTEEQVTVWAEMLKDVEPVHARAAVEEHFKSKPDVYINVGHVFAGAQKAAKSAADRALSEARLNDESTWRADPQPVCEAHGLRILGCDDCCSLIFTEADYMSVDDRHSWASHNVYAAKSSW